MIEVLFFSFLSSFQIFISGYLFHYFLISKDINILDKLKDLVNLEVAKLNTFILNEEY